MEVTKILHKSSVFHSPAYPTIMRHFEIYGKTMSMLEFYKKYITKCDKKITYESWKRFMRSYWQDVMRKTQEIYDRSVDTSVKESVLEEGAIRKILAIADVTLEQIVADPMALSKIDPKERMNWLFAAMKARDSRMSVALKKKSEDRKDTIWDEVLRGAQYGAVNEGEVDMVDNRTEEPKLNAGEHIEIKVDRVERTVEFNPAEL